MNFIQRLNREKFYFSSQSFQIGGTLAGLKLGKHTKFKLNISKIIPSRQKKHRDMGCEYHYSHLSLIITEPLNTIKFSHISVY